MDVIRDVLDKQLVDLDSTPLGMVDGIVMDWDAGERPRLAYIEVGGGAAARRLGRRIGRWVSWLERRWGARRGQPVRIAWSELRHFGVDVRADVRADDAPTLDWERWVREHIIARIPGS